MENEFERETRKELLVQKAIEAGITVTKEEIEANLTDITKYAVTITVWEQFPLRASERRDEVFLFGSNDLEEIKAYMKNRSLQQKMIQRSFNG